MKPFLLELAEKLYREYQRKLDTLTLVFPNRRAALYFRKHLSSLLDRPSFAPRLITIEDFIAGFSTLQVPDKLELIHRLYKVYHQIIKRFPSGDGSAEAAGEPFDQFYFWGDMLLRDFDEADKYLVNTGHLFKDLSHQRELDVSFDFLTDEQKEFLKSFWLNFDEQDSANKRKFLYIWRQLPMVYEKFREELRSAGLAYEGMLHREVAEDLLSGKSTSNALSAAKNIVFIGFNAFTKAEEAIITHFIAQGVATAHWDVDAYYINNNTQEAGKFFREYQQHPVLAKTFPNDVPANFLESGRDKPGQGSDVKTARLFGAAQPVGQAKLMAQILEEELKKGIKPEETLIVLPDEKLLMPVLHGVAGNVENLNVTMGFPLSSTPVFNLIELLIELQISHKDGHFNHRPVLALMGHPYVVAADPIVANAKRKEILQHNWVSIPQSFLAATVELHRLVFRSAYPENSSSLDGTRLIGYLRSIVAEVGNLTSISDFDKEYAFHFVKLLNRMEEIVMSPAQESGQLSISSITSASLKNSLKSFLRLFRQLIRAEKIPFRGEPLKGLQVMGVLETRNLDFKNVFVLSLNEGAFPSFNSKGSYIPFNIRRAYGLPTAAHQDAIYAYLFYRLLQRAENIFLFYNSETDVLGQGEMSRYLQQLLYESGLKIEKQVLHNRMQPHNVGPILVTKDERIFNELARHCAGHRALKELTPTALNDYIECRLKFYFRHVARIREAREVEEDLDARVLGNFLHRVMELFYRQIIEQKQSHRVEAPDFDQYEKRVDAIIDRIFIETYKLDPQKKVQYEGQRLVVREVVKRFVDRIIMMDKDYAPFTLEAIELRGMTHAMALEAEGKPTVMLGGIIDRADRKGDLIRVIDYKTGKDELTFENIASLFSREGKRNKAAFQTMLYALLYKKHLQASPGMPANLRLVPGLMNRVNLFDEGFTFGLKTGKDFVTDATPLLPEFEAAIKTLLEELYNPAVPFDQTHDLEICRICSYRGICYR